MERAIWRGFCGPRLRNASEVAADYRGVGLFRFDRDECWREAERLKRFPATFDI